MHLTAERLREALIYDPETGEFIRRVPVRGWLVGSRAGSQRPDGRVAIVFDGGRYLRSRLAWFYVYGGWPEEEIDHINGNYGDDRIANLRPANRAQQLMNARRRRDNTSGYKGVHWSKKDRWWVASIRVEGKCKWLGGHSSAEAAYEVYCAAAREYFGIFARTT